MLNDCFKDRFQSVILKFCKDDVLKKSKCVNAAGVLETLWDPWQNPGTNPQAGSYDQALEAAAIIKVFKT